MAIVIQILGTKFCPYSLREVGASMETPRDAAKIAEYLIYMVHRIIYGDVPKYF